MKRGCVKTSLAAPHGLHLITFSIISFIRVFAFLGFRRLEFRRNRALIAILRLTALILTNRRSANKSINRTRNEKNFISILPTNTTKARRIRLSIFQASFRLSIIIRLEGRFRYKRKNVTASQKVRKKRTRRTICANLTLRVTMNVLASSFGQDAFRANFIAIRVIGGVMFRIVAFHPVNMRAMRRFHPILYFHAANANIGNRSNIIVVVFTTR